MPLLDNIDDMTNMPDHPVLSSKVAPDGLKIEAKTSCGLCKLCDSSPSHTTYKRGKLTNSLPATTRYNLEDMAALQWTLSRLNLDINSMIGQPIMGANFMINARDSLNFADANGFVIVSAIENKIVLMSNSDPNHLGLYATRYVPDGNIFFAHKTIWGCIQPNDELTFTNSCLEGKSKPKVVRVIDWYHNEQGGYWLIQLELDQDVTHCMWSTNDEIYPTAQYYTCNIWRQAGSIEKFTSIIEPSFFYAIKIKLKLNRYHWLMKSPDGIVELMDNKGNPTLIAIPKLGNELSMIPATFTAKTVLQDDTRVDWYGQLTERIKMVQTAGGEQHTYLCLGTKDHTGATKYTDLRDQIKVLNITYYAKATEDDIKSKKYFLPNSARCKNCIEDKYKSNYKAVDGTYVNIDKDDNITESWYCAVRRQVNYVEQQQPEGHVEIVEQWSKPTGLANFNKNCYQYGTCDRFELADDTPEDVFAPFNLYYKLASYIKELWCGVPAVLKQLMPGISSFRNYQIFRPSDGHPSIRSLLGNRFAPYTPAGQHEQSYPQQYGQACSFCTIVTDQNGDERILRSGNTYPWDEDFDMTNTDWSGVDFPALSNWCLDQNKKRLLYYNYNEDNTSDPTRSIRGYEHDMGWRMNLNTFEFFGRGLSQWGHVLANNEYLVFPRLSTQQINIVQDTGEYTVEFFDETTKHTIMGTDYYGLIKIKPLISTTKEPSVVVTGTIHSITNNNNGTFAIELKNETHYWSEMLGDPGNKFDVIHSYDGGGHFVRLPDWAHPIDYYDDHSSYGGTTDLATVGDSITFDVDDGEYGVPDLRKKQFLINETIACGGSAADNWGEKKIIIEAVSDGFYEIPETIINTPDKYPFLPISTVIENYDDLATRFYLSSNMAVNVGMLLQINGEVVSVSAVNFDDVYIDVQRAQLGTDANSITVGDTIELIGLYDSNTNQILNLVKSDVRPGALTEGYYWIDADTNRFIFSQDDANKTLSIQFAVWYVDYDITDTSKRYTYNIWVPVYAEVRSNLDYDTHVGYTRQVYITDMTTPITETFDAQIPYGQYRVHKDGTTNYMFFRFNLSDSSKKIRIRIVTEVNTVTPQPRIYCNGFDTWGKCRDKITVYDESNYLDVIAQELVGSSITCWRNAAICFPTTITVGVTPYRIDLYENIPANDVRIEYGTGNIWLTAEAVDKMKSLGDWICVRI